MDTDPHTSAADLDMTRATRHLAAAAYLDRDFCRQALTKVYGQRQRDVAPSPGFDLEIVMAHCLRASRGAFVRDGSLVLVLAAGVVNAPRALLDVVMGLALMYLVIGLGRLGARWLAGPAATPSAAPVRRRDGALALLYERSRTLWSAKAFLIGYAVALATLAGLIALEILLNLRAGDEVGASAAFRRLTGLMVLLAAVFGVCALWALWRHHSVSRLGIDRPLSIPRTLRRHPARFAHLRAGNTTTHSGYSPFIGSGHPVSGWSFAGRLINGDPGALFKARHALNGDEVDREFRGDLPFTTGKLLARLRKELGPLAGETSPGKQLAGIEVYDHVYVPASETSDLCRHTDPGRMEELIRRPVQPARHYLVCQVVAWGGELVTTVFLHVAIQGATMYLECSTTALLPCKEEYRLADRTGGRGATGLVRALLGAVTDTPGFVGAAPFRAVQVLADGFVALSRRTRPGRRWARRENYGVEFSVREEGQVEKVGIRSQMQDVNKYKQIVERRILACVLDFLVEHKVDTSEFRERQSVVLNAGVVNTGEGSVNVHGDAVGQANSMPHQPAGAAV